MNRCGKNLTASIRIRCAGAEKHLKYAAQEDAGLEALDGRHMAEENAVRSPGLGDDYELGCSADSPSCNILFTRVKHLWEARVRRNSTRQRRKSSTEAERRRPHGSLRIFLTKWTAVSTTDASFYSLSCSSLTAFPGSWSPWKPHFDWNGDEEAGEWKCEVGVTAEGGGRVASVLRLHL